MKHTTLIAIAVGSVLGARLPAAYADGEQPVIAPSPENQQQQQAAVVGSGDTQNGPSDGADRQPDRGEIASDRDDNGDMRPDRRDFDRDRPEPRSGHRDLRTTQAPGATSQTSVTHDSRARDADLNADRSEFTSDRRDIASDRSDIARDQHDMARDKADIQADRRDLAKDRADIHRDARDLRADAQDVRRDRLDLRNDRMDVRNDRQDLHTDRRDVRSDRLDVQAAGNAGQPDADKRMRTVTALNQRNDARDIRAANAGHAAAAQPLTATTLANNTAAENNKKQTSTETARKPWYHYFWWQSSGSTPERLHGIGRFRAGLLRVSAAQPQSLRIVPRPRLRGAKNRPWGAVETAGKAQDDRYNSVLSGDSRLLSGLVIAFGGSMPTHFALTRSPSPA